MASPELVFAGTDGGAVTDLGTYEERGGLTALRRAREMTPDEIVAERSYEDDSDVEATDHQLYV